MSEPTLLVIEPHENLRAAYASVLRFAGYRVHEASCGISARDRLLTERPGLVLMNVQLPLLEDALLLVRRSRADVGLQGTTWVALCRSDGALSGAQQAEFDAVLQTPLSYTQLVGTASLFAGGERSGHGSVSPIAMGSTHGTGSTHARGRLNSERRGRTLALDTLIGVAPYK